MLKSKLLKAHAWGYYWGCRNVFSNTPRHLIQLLGVHRPFQRYKEGIKSSSYHYWASTMDYMSAGPNVQSLESHDLYTTNSCTILVLSVSLPVPLLLGHPEVQDKMAFLPLCVQTNHSVLADIKTGDNWATPAISPEGTKWISGQNLDYITSSAFSSNKLLPAF